MGCRLLRGLTIINGYREPLQWAKLKLHGIRLDSLTGLKRHGATLAK